MLSVLKSAKIGLFLSLVTFPMLALADLKALPKPTMVIPAAPAIAAKSFILMDPLSSYVITEQNADLKVEPASLTKMMTVYVLDHALKNNKIKLEDTVKISKNAWKTSGSRMFVQVDTLVPVSDLLKGIIIQSGNDASVAIAEHMAGSEETFSELMNFYAKELGMNNTHFVNATGLPDPNHYTSARDMAILAKALIRDFPETYKLYSQKEFTYQDIKQDNRNRLLWRDDKYDGIKTGFTDSAGYCLVASGKKDQMRLISVVMGAKSESARIEESNKLLTYGFGFFETRQLYPAGAPLQKSRIWMGKEKEVELGLLEDLYITIGQGQYDNVKASIKVEKILKAPAQQGAPLGTLAIQLNDKTLIEKNIVALNEIHMGGFLNRMYDSVALSFHKLLDKFNSEKVTP